MEHTKAYQEFKKNSNTKFVRYSEGAEMYHMGVSKFMQMAKDAKAIYKLGQLVLVNLIIFDEYLETSYERWKIGLWRIDCDHSSGICFFERFCFRTWRSISILLLDWNYHHNCCCS